MTREEAIVILEQCESFSRNGHEQADKVLTDLLITLGYKDVVDAYEEIEKWYA